MDKRRGALNAGVAVVSKVVLLVAALIVRRLVIQVLGNDVNGLNSLYASIIGALSVAELGIGAAIVYTMYQPIVDGDKRKVAALYSLYQRLYRVVGAVIFVGGLVVMPFLPRLIGDYDALDVNVYATFFLTLVSVVLTYLYGAKTSLLQAHKNDYVVTGIVTTVTLVQYVLQVTSVLVLRSFEAYLFCQIVQTLLAWVLTQRAVRRRHGDVIVMRECLSSETRAQVVKNVRAMCMHRIGGVLVSMVDSLVISTFIGVAMLGTYTNYALIAGVVLNTISLFFSSLTSVIGHLCAEENAKRAKESFGRLYSVSYVLGVVFFVGYYAVADYAVALCFGEGLEIARSVVFVVALNQFLQYMRNVPLLFRDATGTFYNDRWKPVAEGVANLALSLVLVNVLPDELRVVGVVLATVITTLAICDVVEPWVVFRHGFGVSPRGFYCRSYAYAVLFAVSLVAMGLVMRPFEGVVVGLLANGLLSLVVSGVALTLLVVVDTRFRDDMRAWAKEIRGLALRLLGRVG